MKKKILVVEDNEDNRRILVYRLRKIGDFDIIEAQNGLDAIEMTEKHSPDLIFMDLKMPVMDGFEAIRRLKADEATTGIPIIALTAHAMQEDMHRALQAGAEGYETKPVNIDQLLEKIQSLLPTQAHGDSTAPPP